MDIQELEFIRDFADLIAHLNMDMQNLTSSIDDGDEDEKIKEIPLATANFAWSVLHNLEVMEKYFLSFKEKIDEKYHHVWCKKYPQMCSDYREYKEGIQRLDEVLMQNA